MKARSLMLCVSVFAATLVAASPAGAASSPTINIKTAVTAAEPGGSAKVVVKLSEASDRTIKVDYETVNGGTAAIADSDADYVPEAGTLVFKPGRTRTTIKVTLTDDVLDEDDEGFMVYLGNPRGAKLGKKSSEVTIADDDASPTVSVGDVGVLESSASPLKPITGFRGSVATTYAQVPVNLSAVSGRDVVVNWSTTPGSATGDDDFVNVASGSVTVDAGNSNATIYVGIIDDIWVESEETFTVNLLGATNATIADGSGVVTIYDDDACALIGSPRLAC